MYRFLDKGSLLVEICCCRKLSSSSFNHMKVLFFGTDNFSLGTLKALNEIRLNNGAITLLDIISCGKSRYIKKQNTVCVPPVLKYATSHDLRALSWEKVKQKGEFEIHYDLGVIASFGDFIPGKLLSLIKRGAINIHPSLLPKFRGPAPVIHTILSGDDITGISIIEASTKKFDVGKILYQKEFPVPHQCTSDYLLKFLSGKCDQLIPYVINNIDELQSNAKTQCEHSASYAPKVSKRSGYIDFETHSASYLERLQRALPSKIGIRASWDGKEVKFGKIEHVNINSENNTLPSGSCWYDKDKKLLSIKVMDGNISVSALKIECRKEISASSFYNGYIIDKNTGRPGIRTFGIVRAQ